MTTILVIEDTRDIRELIAHTLTFRQYTVLAANNGREGVEIAQEKRPDLIICDIMMPQLTGYDVYQQLFEANIVPVTPFIFLTALDQRQDIRRGMILGADDYIVKPFSATDILESVASVLQRRELLARAYKQGDTNYDIFLSYSHEDRENMNRVRTALQDAGFAVWTDEEIEPSRDWAEAIAEMIKHTDCLVAVLSENAAESKWVGRELGYAEANDSQIFPILLKGDHNKCIPLRLINHQFIDARQNFQEGAKKLVEAIRGHLAVQGK